MNVITLRSYVQVAHDHSQGIVYFGGYFTLDGDRHNFTNDEDLTDDWAQVIETLQYHGALWPNWVDHPELCDKLGEVLIKWIMEKRNGEPLNIFVSENGRISSIEPM